MIFEAIRDHRVTTMLVVPQVLDLFWSAIEREVDKSGRRATFDRLRGIARHLPYGARRVLFRRVHRQLGGELNLFVCAAAFLPPSLQQAWEDVGVVVMQGYGATECGPGQRDLETDHGLGTVGRTIPPVQVKLAEGGEILVSGPTLFGGYWRDDAATAAAFTDDGWYRTGDIGRHDDAGHLILMGRIKDIIVLPNGFNVYPEDIENALRTAGIRDSVVIETAARPDRGRGPRAGRGGRAPRWRPAGSGRGRPPSRPRGAPGRDRCGRETGQLDAGIQPAGRRLAVLAGRRLPADPHPQGEARPDPRPGPWSSSRCRSIRRRSGPRPRASPAPGPA